MALGFRENDELFIPSSYVGGTHRLQTSHTIHCTLEKILKSIMCTGKSGTKKSYPVQLNRTLVGAELKYSPIEKICLSIVFAIQKLRYYMQAYTVQVLSKADPLNHILSRPILNG